jgi:hypothetical protein
MSLGYSKINSSQIHVPKEDSPLIRLREEYFTFKRNRTISDKIISITLDAIINYQYNTKSLHKN